MIQHHLRAAIAMACIIWMTTLSSTYGSAIQSIPFAYSAPFLWLIVVVLLPPRFVWLSIPVVGSVLWLLSYLNARKISAIQLPITFFDLRMAISEPAALANALGFAGSSLLLPLTIIACLTTVAAALVLGRRLRRRSPVEPTQFPPLRWRVCAGAVIACIATSALVRHANYVRTTLPQKHSALWLDLWIPEKQAALSRAIGLPEYLAFSWLVEQVAGEGPPVEVRKDGESLADIGRYLDVRGRSLMPNVVLFHAESTFDPNRAFKLEAPVTLPLWSGVPKTRAIGPLRVNIVGGGSWVTDFEVITGVDTRLFGFQGFYTTYYVAPMVRYSLPMAASMRGYRTTAYSTVSGEFYNYRNAFRHYGFAQFVDGPSLGMSSDWSEIKDEAFVDAVIRSGAFSDDQTAPFFYYIDTTENHGPHPCRTFTRFEQLPFSYAGGGDFDQNCELNEYIRRAESTSAAFEKVLEQLGAIESRTGRPYVLLAYGDHQPWDFTDGLYSAGTQEVTEPNFRSLSALRTSASLKETFFHLVASETNIVSDRWRTTAPPATLLATLVSGFMASHASELYMPDNLALDQHCPADIVAGCDRVDLAYDARSRLLSGR